MNAARTPATALSRQRAAAAVLLLPLLLAACAAPVTRTTRIYDEPAPAAFAGVEYGTVRRIEVADTIEQPSGGGTVLGGLVGGVIGNQIGHGAGRAAATVLGAFGGGVIGNQIEQDQAARHSGRVYHVVVRLDHGGTRRFDFGALNGLRVGDRVRLDHGVLGPA